MKSQKYELVNFDIADLTEHPKNVHYSTPMSEEMWEAFKKDIEVNGLQSPLTYNEATKFIIKGCHRLRAVKELHSEGIEGLDKIPCLVIKIEDPNREIEELIRDNIMRKEEDIIRKFKYINYLQQCIASRQGKAAEETGEGGKRDRIAKMINESTRMITMANLYESLSEERKKELEEWYFFNEDKTPTKKEISEKLKQLTALEKKVDTLQATNDNLREQQDEMTTKYNEVVDKLGKTEESLKEFKEIKKDVEVQKKLVKNIERLQTERSTLVRDRATAAVKSCKIFMDEADKTLEALSKEKDKDLIKDIKQHVNTCIESVGNWVTNAKAAMEKIK